MASTHRAPKQWCLSKVETVNTYENWRQNLKYTLSLDPNFAQFLVEDCQWGKKIKSAPLRGFTDDIDTVPADKRKTAQQKVTLLELMLGQIANYCPIISRNTIIKTSTSIQSIWQVIRLHYGFQSTGAHFIDFSDIHLRPDERPEDLYQRLMAFAEDNLLRSDSGISHHGQPVSEDEELSPSLENFVVLTWLRLIHTSLPKLVKQRYGTELRSRTLASIKPEISQALDSLLDEIRASDDAKAMRAATSRPPPPRPSYIPQPRSGPRQQRRPSRTQKSCPICKQVGRNSSDHFLSECPHLPEQDRRFILKARQIAHIMDNSPDDEPPVVNEDEENCGTDHDTDTPSAFRVRTRQSPYLDTFCGHHTVRITIDTGATGNMISASTAKRLGATVKESSQSAHQADGSSPLTVTGETRLTLSRDGRQFQFEALVIENLDVAALGGTPFMESNDLAVRPAKRLISLADGTSFIYGSHRDQSKAHSVRRAHVLHAPSSSTTVWPGEFIELQLPKDISSPDSTFALEPRTDTPSANTADPNQPWPAPDIINSVAGKIRIPNLTTRPHVLKRHEHFCQVRPVYVPTPDDKPYEHNTNRSSQSKRPTRESQHSHQVSLDPDNILPTETRAMFQSLNQEFDEVFNPEFSGYNGYAGPFEAVINMGPVQPPQRKGRLPQYSKDKLQELQQKFDDLEERGVFARPEDMDITVEYLNPSFLVKKANGGFRLVTAFADVGRYSKPQPALMPDVNSTLRQIAQWKHIIATDLTSAFYQIPLSRSSLKYCGVATPFRGVRVYTRSAMGMPGSETALEELMCRVFGDLLKEGIVAKIADDLYCGGNTHNELLHNWRRVLHALYNCELRLSATKTIICPKTTTILGWVWSLGTLRASPHRVATLASCSFPEKVTGLRSFIGAYKVLARVLPNCASIISPLDDIVAGRQSADRLQWTDETRTAFTDAQTFLSKARTITLPRPDDQLWIVTDGAVKSHGIGATMYVTRHGTLFLAGFFSAKLRGRQPTWLPCEIEALSIAAATKHFSPYIIQSTHKTSILTDSKPCVQAFEKLCRGEFSASPRVSTFLSTVSRFQATVRHLAGSANIPSDFASRNAQVCTDSSCQICSFVRHTEDSVVQRISTQDIIAGKAKLPFTSRSAWSNLQAECSDLRRTHAHLLQGTRPSKKTTNAKDVKRYLNVATLAKDGLLIVHRSEPLAPARECVIVPRQVLDGLLTALHIQLDHPSCHQLKCVVHRYFYALDMDKAIDKVSSSCHQCAALRNAPASVKPQATADPPDAVGISFAADVIKRSRQLILVVRESVTSFTAACFIEDERHTTLRDALITLCIELRPLDGPPAVIRTDPAPGFQSLVTNELLQQHRLSIEIGRIKNVNKNPVAEKAVRELADELLRQDPTGGAVTPLTLALATSCLNSRIRSRGLSAREMWYHRDQFTNGQIPITDRQLILDQHNLRNANHPHSEKAKSPSGKIAPDTVIAIGDLVYLHGDRNKTKGRSRYLVTAVDGLWCNIRKFVGSQLRSTSYRVRRSECFKVPCNSDRDRGFPSNHPGLNDNDSADEADTTLAPAPPTPPSIPIILSTPAEQAGGPPSPDNRAPHELDTSPPASQIRQPTVQPDSPGDMSIPCPRLPSRRSSRLRKPPSYLDDYITEFDTDL